nr:hypothetical protein [Candidatus Pelagibacter sp.]
DCVENDYIDGMLENDQSCFSIDITPVMINDVGETYTVTSFPYNESQSDYIKFEISVDSEISSDENLIFSNNEEASVTISKGEISVSEDYNIVELENGGLVSFSISYIPVVDGDSVYGNYVATLRYPTGCDGNCVVLKSVAFSIDVAVVGCMDESEDVCNYNSEATYPCTDNECCIHKQTYYSDNDGDGLGCCKNGEYSEYCPDELPETSFEIDLPLNSDGNPINVDVDSHNRYCYDIGYTKTDISLDDLLSDENDTGKLCKSWEGGYWVDTECNDMLEKAVCEMYPYVTDVEIGCYSEDPGEDFIAGMCECEFNTLDDCGACLDAKCLPISDFQSEGDLYDLITDTYLVNPTNGLFYVYNPCYNGEVVTNANWNLNCTGCGRSDSSNYNSSFDNSSDGIHCKGIGGDGEIGSYNELLSIGQLCMGHCSNKSSVKCWTNSDCIYNDISLGDCYYDLPGWGNQGNSCCCDIKSGCIDPEDPNYNSSAILDCDGELAAYCLFSKYLIGPSLNDSISGNETSIYLSSTETLNKNEYLKIDNEVVLINSVYSNRIEVTRGVVGTDSESHAGGTVTVEERGSCSYTIGLDEYDQSCCVGYTKYACTDPNAKNYYCFGGVDNRINDMTRCDELEIPATGTRHYDVVKCNSDLYGNGILDSANGFPGGNCGKHYFGRMEEDIAPNWIKQDGVVNNFQAQSIGQFPSNTCVNITEMAVDTSIDNINGCGFGYNFNERFGENNWTSTVELIDDSPIPELSKALKIEIDTYDLLCGATDQSDCGVGGLYISNNYSDMGNSHYYMWVKVVSGNINIGFNDTDNMVTHGVTDGWEIISSMDALTASYNSDIFDISVDATGGGVEVYILEYGLYESYTGGAGTDCCCEYEYDCYGKRILTTDWNFNDNSCTGNSGPCADYDNCGICSSGADAYDTVIVANSDNYGCGCFRGPPPIWHKDSDFDGTGCDCLTSGCITYPSGESVDYGYGASWQNCLLHQLPVFDVAGDVNQFVKNYPFGYLPIVHTQFYNLGEDIW